ncbi:unnamed protein product [Adineta ricciae]|uniref:Nbr1 FW domain-containing protein n=1 Tax=Adineta ricciae TaxID=249248 RepID=A0A815GVW1_ADIRI|nr:unnamed protein product [Adineta ricciae]CAF1345722.1 unnamed protein product [Adineta ricciae]
MLPTTVSMSHLDEELMGRLRSITTNNREDLIAQFRATTNAMLTDEGCTFFLELSNWNLNEAILAYYDAEMPTDKIPQMRFVGDITIGDGEAIPPNTKFVKTWRVENSGTERWPSNCSLRFVNGDRFQERDEVYVSSLAPGEQTNISVHITSPSGSRIIRSQWRLFTAAGVPFGDPIWVVASVEEGGLMGITQQLAQCHSLGLNSPAHIQQASHAFYQSPPSNPFQSTRYSGPSSDPNTPSGSVWTNYSLGYYPHITNFHHATTDSSTASAGIIDDSSLDTF